MPTIIHEIVDSMICVFVMYITCTCRLVQHMGSDVFMQSDDLCVTVLQMFKGMIETPPDLNEAGMALREQLLQTYFLQYIQHQCTKLMPGREGDGRRQVCT